MSSFPDASALSLLLSDLDRLAERYPGYSGRVQLRLETLDEYELTTYDAGLADDDVEGYAKERVFRAEDARRDWNRAAGEFDIIAPQIIACIEAEGQETPQGVTPGARLAAWLLADQLKPRNGFGRGSAFCIGNVFSAIRRRLLSGEAAIAANGNPDGSETPLGVRRHRLFQVYDRCSESDARESARRLMHDNKKNREAVSTFRVGKTAGRQSEFLYEVRGLVGYFAEFQNWTAPEKARVTKELMRFTEVPEK